MRLRLIEGGQGPAQPTEAKPEQFNEEATVITSAAPFDPDDDGLDAELDAETVLVPGSDAPLALPPEAVPPELLEPPRRSSMVIVTARPSDAAIAYAPHTSAAYPPPVYPPPAYPVQDPYRASSGSIPPYAFPPPQQIVTLPAPPAGRGKLVLALALGGVLVAGGLVLGWVLFRSDAPPAAEPVVTPAPAPVPAPAPPEITAPPPPAPAKITSRVHPVLADVTSPVGGRVVSVAVAKPRAVEKGDVLLDVRGGAKRTASTIALEKKVAELETLAKEDRAAYAPFLASARRKLAMAQRTEPVTVTATQTGVFQSKVRVGDKVADGAIVGVMIDPQTWHAVATVRGATPLASWSCVVATPDSRHSAACEIATTEAVADGTQITVTLPAASWLEDPALEAQILVAPR